MAAHADGEHGRCPPSSHRSFLTSAQWDARCISGCWKNHIIKPDQAIQRGPTILGHASQSTFSLTIHSTRSPPSPLVPPDMGLQPLTSLRGFLLRLKRE